MEFEGGTMPVGDTKMYAELEQDGKVGTVFDCSLEEATAAIASIAMNAESRFDSPAEFVLCEALRAVLTVKDKKSRINLLVTAKDNETMQAESHNTEASSALAVAKNLIEHVADDSGLPFEYVMRDIFKVHKIEVSGKTLAETLGEEDEDNET